jgi:hypothetical protein
MEKGARVEDVMHRTTKSYAAFKQTFSGAEEFSYNLKNLKRTTVVGSGMLTPTLLRRIRTSIGTPRRDGDVATLSNRRKFGHPLNSSDPVGCR